MKSVKLLARKGTNKAGTIVSYPDGIADWMVSRGYAEPVAEKAPESPAETPAAAPEGEKSAPRRGRPRKAAQP